jgi:hypothetical protein
MKTPEEMAEEWASSRWYANHDPTVSGESKVAFLAGYKAGYESLREEIHALTSQLRQANGMVMKLEAER